MTMAPTGENPGNLSARQADDLTAIKGIGLARQRWLRESLNVRTFQDLASLPADELESRLKAEGQIVSRSDLDRWIAKARELAVAASLVPQRIVESATARTEAKVNSPGAKGDWKPAASFVVEFQAREVEGRPEERRTTVHYMESDRSQTWPGIKSQQLCQWMLDQMGKKAEWEPEEEPAAEARPGAAVSVMVEITEVQAFQPPQAETPIGIGRAGQTFSGFLRSSEPFALAVSFTLTGPTAVEIAKRLVTYSAQFHTRNLSTGERTHLGDTKPDTIVKSKLSYVAVLPSVTLQSGMYHLRVLATLQGVRAVPGYLEVPLLQVA